MSLSIRRICDAVSVTGPGCKLHVPSQFFHLGEEFLSGLDRTNLVLVPVKTPYRDVLDQRSIDKLFGPFQAGPGRGRRRREKIAYRAASFTWAS